MINQTNIDAEIKVVYEKVIASNKRKARDHSYFNDNKVVRTFIFDKAGYEIFDPYNQSISEIERKYREFIDFFNTFLIGILVVGTGVCFFILLTKLLTMLAGYSLGIRFVVATFFVCLLVGLVGALYYCYQKWAAQQLPQKQKITHELLKELSTLSTLSETGRTYISKLLDQLPPETEPTFILNTFYQRDMAIYDDAEAVQHD